MVYVFGDFEDTRKILADLIIAHIILNDKSTSSLSYPVPSSSSGSANLPYTAEKDLRVSFAVLKRLLRFIFWMDLTAILDNLAGPVKVSTVL